MKEIISIIVPVYNVESYLKKCLNSLMNQTYKNIKIILVNDGSTDGSKNICEEYSLIDNRIKVINQENKGVAQARNVGLDIAEGEYVLFVDPDDWCEFEMIKEIYIQNQKCDLVTYGYFIDFIKENYTVERNLKKTKIYKTKMEVSGFIKEMEMIGFMNSCCNKMYKKKIIDDYKIRFESDSMPGEDLLFNIKFLENINSIKNINKAYYHYLKIERESMSNKYIENLFQKIKIFNLARKKLYIYYDMNVESYEKLYMKSYIEYIISYISNIFKTKQLSEKNKRIKIKELINDEEFMYIVDKFTPNIILEKILKLIFKLKNENLIYLFYKILYFGRKKFKKIYLLLRKKNNQEE